MLALGSAAAAVVVAAVVVGVSMAVVMQVLMGVGMGMVMVVGMGVLVAVGMAIVGMFMGVGMGMRMAVLAMDMVVIVVVMHNEFSFTIDILYPNYTRTATQCQNIYFSRNIPPPGLRKREKQGIMGQSTVKEGKPMHDHEHEHAHAYGVAHSHGHVHENQRAVVNRLSRAIGHLEKVKRMVEEGYDCSEVLIQLAAVRSALDNTGKVILKDHMRHCMVDAVAAGDESAIDDLCQAIDKFMK